MSADVIAAFVFMVVILVAVIGLVNHKILADNRKEQERQRRDADAFQAMQEWQMRHNTGWGQANTGHRQEIITYWTGPIEIMTVGAGGGGIGRITVEEPVEELKGPW